MTDKTPLLADDEIKALAREAGCPVVTDRYGTMTFQAYGDNLRKFVALVAERAAAAEREACANVCDDIADTNKWSDAVAAAEAIRARSKA